MMPRPSPGSSGHVTQVPESPQGLTLELLQREALFELLFLSEQTVTLKLLRTISAITPRNKAKTEESRA